ncbi:hypothetical protein FSP39_018153, partial [Pinctada imbricata]
VNQAVKVALDSGYRHIDTAYNYKNEGAIGEALDEYIKAGKVKREELFIVTKAIHMNPKQVRRSIESSLKRLRTDYVDLYLLHSPIGFQVECHLYFPNAELADFCRKRNVTLTAYAPIGSPGRPPNPLQDASPNLMEDPTVVKVAEKHNKTPAQVLLRALMQKGIIVIPKSITPERIKQNLQVCINLLMRNMDFPNIVPIF